MRTRNLIIGLALAGLCLTAVFYQSPVNDPVYKGRLLSDWVQSEGFHTGGLRLQGSELPPDPGISVPPSNPEFIEAISKAGTDALPLLVRMIGRKESRMELWLQSMADNHSFIRRFVRPRSNLETARQFGAVASFYQLGPQAAPALPAIIPLLKDPDFAGAAMLAIMYIRPEREQDILQLTNVLHLWKPARSGGPEHSHLMAILVLSTFGSKASGAVPILLEQMTSTNGNVRAAAAVALARIGAPSEKAVPLILRDLEDVSKTQSGPMISGNPSQIEKMIQFHFDDMHIRMNIWALGQYAQNARAALPTLTNLLFRPSSGVCTESEIAIKKITAGTNQVSR